MHVTILSGSRRNDYYEHTTATSATLEKATGTRSIYGAATQQQLLRTLREGNTHYFNHHYSTEKHINNLSS